MNRLAETLALGPGKYGITVNYLLPDFITGHRLVADGGLTLRTWSARRGLALVQAVASRPAVGGRPKAPVKLPNGWLKKARRSG
jgi:hypothetical protein